MVVYLWATVAAVAMFIEDILSTLLTQAAARNRANLSGLLDSACWIAAIVTTALTLDILDGHNFKAKVAVIVLVSLANYLGTVAGVDIGKKLIKVVVR